MKNVYHGHNSFYTQTWSGNLAMVRVAEKLGFKEVCRKKKFREVDGKIATLNLRVNSAVKENAENVLAQLGIPMATAIDMYLK